MAGILRCTHRATPSSAGRPTPVPACPRCLDWARTMPYRGAGEQCMGALSSMTKHWSGGDEPADQSDAVDDGPPRPDTDPVGDEAESDRDDQPAEVHPEPDEHAPVGATRASRPGTAARGPMTRLLAAV